MRRKIVKPEQLHRANETVDARIKEAYCWLLVPYIDKMWI
jgi:hypothetical protein